ncbi:protein phosphatase 5 [Mitosporidium daphniae]|uniref:Serine/threonine-protein phosphatase n=1 Tax=Mitosporidium daphniae TaxID=1485682 RepID=A0A098VUS4_9MICR|nr:protein phosphatase 5 [Mitosporidium daphniae]KGG52700.1 protein phosphatase 5 [Mitosporidium daphniae]|eukprot:XP_013239136.1 protein phosphatase 5 [Mitosporidium daphniae]
MSSGIFEARLRFPLDPEQKRLKDFNGRLPLKLPSIFPRKSSPSPLFSNQVPPSGVYTGPRLLDETKTISSVHDILIPIQWICNELVPFLREKTPSLPIRYVYQIMFKAYEMFRLSPRSPLVRVDVPHNCKITICGDVHGQFLDLINIFEINGWPSKSHYYLFNGDFVDRGPFSVETILTLLSLKCAFPSSFFMNRGNHETSTMNKIYGFEAELTKKYSSYPELFGLFQDLFNSLPLCHVIQSEIFVSYHMIVSHGGIPREGDITLAQIEKIDRFSPAIQDSRLEMHFTNLTETIVEDLLWADPTEGTGILPSQRGTSVMFGSDITEKFLATNNLKRIIRSHEYKEEGYATMHQGCCVTIFSAPGYMYV